MPTASELEVEVTGRLTAEEAPEPEPPELLPPVGSATPEDVAGEVVAEVTVPLLQECD